MEIIIRSLAYGYKLEEVPIVFVERIYGESKLGASEFSIYLKGVWYLLKTFWIIFKYIFFFRKRKKENKKQKALMSFFRSETMSYYEIIIPRESAWEVFNELGKLSIIQMED